MSILVLNYITKFLCEFFNDVDRRGNFLIGSNQLQKLKIQELREFRRITVSHKRIIMVEQTKSKIIIQILKLQRNQRIITEKSWAEKETTSYADRVSLVGSGR